MRCARTGRCRSPRAVDPAPPRSHRTRSRRRRVPVFARRRAKATDHSGPEVFLDPFDRGGGRRAQEVRFELLTVGAVVHPFTGRRNPLAGGDHRSVADDGDQVAMTARLDAEHTKAAVGVMECDPFNQASEDLTGRRRRRLVCQKEIPHGSTRNRRSSNARSHGVCAACNRSRVSISGAVASAAPPACADPARITLHCATRED